MTVHGVTVSAILICMFEFAYSGSCAAIEPCSLITAEVTSGRRFSGTIGEQSNQQTLWLEVRVGSAVMLRPIDWSAVVSLKSAGKELDIVVLRRALAARTPTDEPEPRRRINLQSMTNYAAPAQIEPPEYSYEPVRSVDFSANGANWDSDVATDGLIITVMPQDFQGGVVPVDGTVHIHLFATRSRSQRRYGIGTTEELVEIGNWTKRVYSDDFVPGGVLLRLPFQNRHPDVNYDLGRWGLVHLRLVVSGSGVFEQSQDGISLRPYSPHRDLLQTLSGRRFLSEERE